MVKKITTLIMINKITALFLAVLLVSGCKDRKSVNKVEGLFGTPQNDIETYLANSSRDSSASQTSNDFDWMRSARTFILDAYTYPFYPRLEYDAEKMAEAMEDMHANTIRIATSGNCDWLIPGTSFPTSPDLGDRDILAETLAACKPRGIRVVPYLRTGGAIRTANMKPEWAIRMNPAGDIKSDWGGGAKRSGACWNTPYRQAFYDLVETVVSQYDIDGLYFDAWILFYRFTRQQGYSVCYCKGCMDGFKKSTGLDLPYKDDPNTYTNDELEIFGKYRDWYREELWEVFQETKRIVHSYKNIPLITNVNSPTQLKREDPRINNGCDGWLYERGRGMLERVEGISLAVSQGLAVWPYVGTYDGYPRIVHHQKERAQEIYTSIAFGGAPILYHTYCFAEHPEGRGIVRDAFQTLDKNVGNIEYLRSLEYCAVIWNDNDPPGHAIGTWLWRMNARSSSLGAFAACLYNHTQVTSLLRQNLDNLEMLNKYKVLYLPGICHLTDKQVDNVRKFVQQGGGLVMTHATSLYDADGRKRADFKLADLARIRYVQPDSELSEQIQQHLAYGSVWDLYLQARPKQSVIDAPLAEGLMPTHVFEVVEPLPGGTVVADIVTGTGRQPLAPGLIVSRFGKGKVAYIPAALDAMYLQTHIPQFADILIDAINYVSPDNPPYHINAPSSVITNMTSNNDKRVLHLVNWTGCKLEKPHLNVDYIPPVRDITIQFTIPQGKQISSVTLFEPAKFSHYRKGDMLHIHLPLLEQYQGVVIQME